MAVQMDGLEEKNRRLGAGLSELGYPEAEAAVPIHPETPTSGHLYRCIPLAKGPVDHKFNQSKHFRKIQAEPVSLFLRFSEDHGRGNFKFCRANRATLPGLLFLSLRWVTTTVTYGAV
jgi:hypothetical protein